MPGTAEIRRHLSRFLKRVRAGERIVVTDRGEPIAELVPYRPGSSDGAAEARLAYLATRGSLVLPKRPLARPLEPVRPARGSPPSPAADAVAGDRLE